MIIIATNKATGNREEVSTNVTMSDAIRYLDQEYSLSKKYPSDKGLYAEFKDIRVTISKEKPRVYKTNQTLYDGDRRIPEGTLFFRGDYVKESKGIEWFEMSTEMHTGHSYSHYNIEQYLRVASPEETEKVLTFLKLK